MSMNIKRLTMMTRNTMMRLNLKTSISYRHDERPLGRAVPPGRTASRRKTIGATGKANDAPNGSARPQTLRLTDRPQNAHGPMTS